jgi:hypothetical protein
VDPGFVRPEAYTILGPFLLKRTNNYKYKIRYKNKYLYRAPPRALCK